MSETIDKDFNRLEEIIDLRRSDFHAEKQTPIIKQLNFENKIIKEYILAPLKEARFSLYFNLEPFEGFGLFLSKKDRNRKKLLKERLNKTDEEIEIWRNCITRNEKEIKDRMLMIYKEDE